MKLVVARIAYVEKNNTLLSSKIASPNLIMIFLS